MNLDASICKFRQYISMPVAGISVMAAFFTQNFCDLIVFIFCSEIWNLVCQIT